MKVLLYEQRLEKLLKLIHSGWEEGICLDENGDDADNSANGFDAKEKLNDFQCLSHCKKYRSATPSATG